MTVHSVSTRERSPSLAWGEGEVKGDLLVDEPLEVVVKRISV